MSISHQDFSDQNVYEMFLANEGPGFWVRRTTWGRTCARVLGIGLMTKPPPYCGNPPVVMDVYSLDGDPKDRLAQLPVPGTYKTWRKIEAPSWASRVELRALDDPAIEATLRSLDRRRDLRS